MLVFLPHSTCMTRSWWGTVEPQTLFSGFMALKGNISSAHICKESRRGSGDMEGPIGETGGHGAIGLFTAQEGEEVECSRAGQDRSMV